MQFAMRFNGLARLLLLPLGSRPGGEDGAHLDDAGLRVRLTAMFDQRFAIADVEEVALARWPWYGGIGLRTDFRSTVGLIASLQGVVRIRFRAPQRMRIVLPVHARELYLSLEDAEGFVSALRSRIVG